MKTLKPKPEYESAVAAAAPDPKLLDFFPRPENTITVTLHCTEVTSLCPVTKQPDFASVTIHYRPKDLCLETKSLKEYLFGFRTYGSFCESMASKIVNDLFPLLQPWYLKVTTTYVPRGGITINSTAERISKWKDQD